MRPTDARTCSNRGDATDVTSSNGFQPLLKATQIKGWWLQKGDRWASTRDDLSEQFQPYSGRCHLWNFKVLQPEGRGKAVLPVAVVLDVAKHASEGDSSLLIVYQPSALVT